MGSGPGDISPDLPALRRAQALAASSDLGVEIGQRLLSLKIAGQAAALCSVPAMDGSSHLVRDHVDQLADCRDEVSLRALESRAANAFWQAVADLPVAFIPSDEARIPASWRTIGRRSSTITGAPRGASTAAQAVWNFAYACAAGEVGVALRSVGLDPGISPTGLHADTPSRASATYDVLEAIRGDVDRLILVMVQGRRFRRRDFVEQVDGRVRLTAPLARDLAEAVLPAARLAVGPIAEGLARTLARDASGPRSHVPTLPTNLTGHARSRGRDGIRNGDRAKGKAPRRAARRLLPPACRRCGLVFEDPKDRRRRLCNECLALAKAEQAAAFVKTGPTALAAMRAQGNAPIDRPEIRRRIGEAQTARRAADAQWERAHPGFVADPDAFRREVLPAIQAISLSRIARATGLSVTHAASIRRGRVIPHPRHWDALRSVATRPT